jgi:type II secretory pathway pseudopilin PulG
MKPGEPKTNNRGFTLVEIVVVILLLFMLLIPMWYSVDRSLRTSNEVYRLATCAFLAQQKVEEIRTIASCYTTNSPPPPANYCQPANNYYNFKYTLFNAPPQSCTFPAPFQQFKCTLTYVSPIVSPGAFFKEIEVRVWFDENNDDVWDANESDVLFQTGMTYRTPAWAS